MRSWRPSSCRRRATLISSPPTATRNTTRNIYFNGIRCISNRRPDNFFLKTLVHWLLIFLTSLLFGWPSSFLNYLNLPAIATLLWRCKISLHLWKVTERRLHIKILYSILLKGTVSWGGFGFWWHVWLVLGLNRGRGHFFNFLGAPMILYWQKCISRV